MIGSQVLGGAKLRCNARLDGMVSSTAERMHSSWPATYAIRAQSLRVWAMPTVERAALSICAVLSIRGENGVKQIYQRVEGRRVCSKVCKQVLLALKQSSFTDFLVRTQNRTTDVWYCETVHGASQAVLYKCGVNEIVPRYQTLVFHEVLQQFSAI